MAKQVTEIDEATGRVRTGKPKLPKEIPWPVTVVDTRWKRFVRKAVG